MSGYVYILTNPSFRDDWVKIGKSSRPVNVRSKELDNTAVPLPFDIYAVMKTEKYNEAEKQIHDLIDLVNPSMRIRKGREFFNVTPEKALSIFEKCAMTLDDAEITIVKESHENPFLNDQIETAVSSEHKSRKPKSAESFTEEYHLESKPDDIKMLYSELKRQISALDNTSIVPKKQCINFQNSREKSFCYLILYKQCIKLVLNMKKGTLDDPDNIANDISNLGHWGQGDYRVDIYNTDDIEKIMKLVKQAYDFANSIK